MDFQTLIEERRSVRYFTDTEVSREALDSILWAANRAPSAGNMQAYEIVVVQDAQPLVRKVFVQQQFR